MEHDDKDDEVITVKMPRWKIQKMEEIIKERQAYDVITGKLKSWWIWAVVGGSLSLIALWDVVKMKVGA